MDRRNKTITLLDGAMGTMLQSAGLPVGELPEVWNITHPETVAEIQRQYVEAGSDILYANTFGANRHKTAGSGYTVAQLIEGGIRAARAAAAGTDTRVALDIGPIGALLEPLGTMSFDEAYDIYKEMVTAGEAAGADLVIFETMSDLYEVKAAVLAAKENTRLPVWVTMTFEATGRTFVGVTVPAMALTLTGLGVDALGFNCSLGPKELLPGGVCPGDGACAGAGRHRVRRLLRHPAGFHCSVKRPYGRQSALGAPGAGPARGLLGHGGRGTQRRPGHRRADQSHRKETVSAGPPGGGHRVYSGAGHGTAGRGRGDPGCERGPAGH